VFPFLYPEFKQSYVMSHVNCCTPYPTSKRPFLCDVVGSKQKLQAVEQIVQNTKFDFLSAWSSLALDLCCVRSHPRWPRSPVGQALTG
jgi:hypothetical protein